MKYILLGLIVFCGCALQAQNQKVNSVTSEDIVAATKANVNEFDRMVRELGDDNKHLGEKLLTVFVDPNSSNLSQCEAAFFIGELKISSAIDGLSTKIALRLDTSHLIVTHLPSPELVDYPAMRALVKIGNPSILAMIRNLTESDDAKVRELSLLVLTRIDGDKDIVQLRLQKALAAEKNSVKQARLQSALKSLAETQFEK